MAGRATLRLLSAALKQREVDERITLDDTGVVSVIEKMLKQRRDSIAQFEQAGRQELADKEKQEMAVLQAYLPQPLTAEELEALSGLTPAQVRQARAERFYAIGRLEKGA